MKKIYLINDEEGIKKELSGMNKESQNKIMKNFESFLKVIVTIEEKNNSVYEYIEDFTGNKKHIDDFNSYEKSIIGQCFNDFIGLKCIQDNSITIM